MGNEIHMIPIPSLILLHFIIPLLLRGVDKKMRLAECVVAREKDLGVNDNQYTVITSLGHILKEGDMVFG